MPDINWGGDSTTAPYSSRYDGTDGDLVLVEDNDGQTVLLEWDGSAFQHRGPVEMNGEDVTGVGALDAQSVSTGELSNVRIVGPSGFDTVQEAHDALPSAGGWILLTQDTTETGTTLTKPVKVTGTNAAERQGGGAEHQINTDGGEGVTVDVQGTVLEDLRISGDGTGGDGLTYQTSAQTARNVQVSGHGGDGVVFDGEVQGCTLDITSDSCGGNGVVINTAETGGYFNENEVHLSTYNHSGDGIRVTGGTREMNGNTFTQTHSAGNAGWGLYVEDGTRLLGNDFLGYGFENNDGGSIYAPDLDRISAGNRLAVADTSEQTVNISPSNWSTIDPSASMEGEYIGYAAGTIDVAIEDDFGDDSGPQNRRGVVQGWYKNTPQDPIVGRFRPRWGIYSGSPSNSGGELVFPDGSTTTQLIQTKSQFQTGEWSMTFQATTTPTSGILVYGIMGSEPVGASDSNVYYLNVGSDGAINLTKFENGSYVGTVVSGSWTPDTAQHTVRVTRTAAGDWELFFDGTSQDTATDTFLPEVNKISLRSQFDSGVAVQELLAK